MKRMVAVALLSLVGASACSAEAAGPPPTVEPAPEIELDTPAVRPFHMGFTRWSYDFDLPAVDWTWEAISQHGDIVAIHLDTGVPWQAVADDTPFPDRVAADLDDARRRSRAFDTVYVSATPQHNDRATIAHDWGDGGTQLPLPPEWDGRPLDDPEVVAAYLTYCRRLIETLEPDYFAYGIEVNAGFLPDSQAHDQIIGLASVVYPALKDEYPNLSVFLTFQVGSWEASNDQVVEITESLLPYTDIVALSAYPFLDFSDPLRTTAPPTPVSDWMERFSSFGKPVAVAETGYAAERLTIETLGIDTLSTPEWQSEYVADLLGTAALLDAQFVIYWEIRDYDEGFQFLLDLGVDVAIASIWRDIGLYDGAGTPRAALGIWRAWLDVPLRTG